MNRESGAPLIAFAGNRRIGAVVLQKMVVAGLEPVALILPRNSREGAAAEFASIAPAADCFEAGELTTVAGMNRMRSLELDYLLSVHYPHILPREVLLLPRRGALNLHPAYLPFNRGWHTPSWAIWEGTPYGATLHWMDEGVDTGPIALQRLIDVRPDETAHELYERVLALEVDLFEEALPLLRENALPSRFQALGGTSHRKADLAKIQNLAAHPTLAPTDVIRLLRALTTNDVSESAYIEVGGSRYYVRVSIETHRSSE